MNYALVFRPEVREELDEAYNYWFVPKVISHASAPWAIAPAQTYSQTIE